MRKTRLAVCISVLVTGLAALGGCERPDPTLRIEAGVAATVNGEPIYLSDVRLEAVSQGAIATGERLEPGDPDFSRILDELVDQKLLAQEAERLALDAEESARHRLQSARERILGNILIESLVAERVDEAAIRTMYDEQVKLLRLGSEVRAAHIVVGTRAEAEAVLADLRDGASFAELAFEKSLDEQTRLEGGDLGYVSPDLFDGAFGRALADTLPGRFAPVFETGDGWHVLRVEDRRQEQPPSLEDLRPDILRFLTLGEIDRTLTRLRAAGTVRREAPAAAPSGDDAP